MNNFTENKQTERFRFELFKGYPHPNGTVSKIRSAGLAYLESGAHVYHVKLFGARSERFMIVPSKVSNEKYQILAKDEFEPHGKPKQVFWNCVGEGLVDGRAGVMCLHFDLYAKPIYMKLYPEKLDNVIPLKLCEPVMSTAEVA